MFSKHECEHSLPEHRLCSKVLAVLTGNGGGDLQMTSGRAAPLPNSLHIEGK